MLTMTDRFLSERPPLDGPPPVHADGRPVIRCLMVYCRDADADGDQPIILWRLVDLFAVPDWKRAGFVALVDDPADRRAFRIWKNTHED